MSFNSDFENRIEQHKGLIFKVIRLYEDREEDVADLYQEVVIQAWRSYSSFRSDSKFSTWL